MNLFKQKKNYRHYNTSIKSGAGYIALIATIVISLVLLVMAIEQGSSGWSARFNVLGTEAKEQASALAEGCAEQALATLLTDPTYTGDVDTTTPGGTCHVFPVQLNFPVAGLVTIKTQAVVRGSYANLDMAMNMNQIHLGSIPTAPTTGTLFITTHVINDSSGTKQAGDFTMNVASTPPTPPPFQGSETGIPIVVQPGAYSVTETTLPNYSVSATTDCSGNIIAGEIRFCTITNDDITTTLTLLANVTNDNNGTNVPTDFSLRIDGIPVTLGQRVTVTAGTHTASTTLLAGYAMSPWGYDCTDDADNATPGHIDNMLLGQNKTCIINFNDLPPPAPACADTVMILDRTGSMSSTDLANEKIAANSLVSLYAGVLPPVPLPQLGVGSIGAYPNQSLPAGAASVPTLGQLTTIFSNLTTIIGQMMGGNSNIGSDLSAGITVASDELNSVRHIAGKEKVIILVSDGDPNEPSGTTNFNTGFSSPTANVQNGVGDSWLNPTNAYIGTDSSANASDVISGANRHRFYNFGFGGGTGLPTGSTVTGIEAQADAWATAASAPTNSANLVPTSLGPSTGWNPNTGSDVSAVTTNDTTAYIVPGPQQETFTFANAGVPAGATINSVTVHAVALGTASTMQLMEENATTQVVEPTTHVLTGAYVDYSYSFPTMPSGTVWTLAEVNAWTTKFGVVNVSGTTARVTQMYVVVGYTNTGAGNAQKAPTGTMGSPNNQWGSPTNAFVSDNVYTTDSTVNHLQGYSNFGFAIPAGATITGIQVTTEAKVSGGAGPTNTATLYPQNNGNYSSWNNGATEVDESGAPSCSSSDAVITGTSNARSSFTLDLSSIPNGSTINSVSISPSDRADSTTGGTYKTFVRLNGVNTDAASILTTTSTSGCTTRSAQTITAFAVKNSGTILEIGVLKVNSGGSSNNTVRVGAINATVNYTPPSTGAISVALSSNNGTSWTANKSVALDTTESVDIPTGNGVSDLWSRGWASTDFNNGNFVLHVTNNSTTGTTVSLDQVTVQVFYITSSSGTSPSLLPTSLGPSTGWNANTGTDVSAVTTNDTTAYIVPGPQQETFAFANAGVPAGSTINSVTVHAVALGSASTMQLMEENATTQVIEPTTHTLTGAYVDYSYSFPTMPSGTVWTLAEVNAWTTKFGVVNVSGTTARVTQMYVVVNYNVPGLSACQLGMDLSWNGGTNWSSEKTQTLSGTEISYLIPATGGINDKWGTHAWIPTDFSNTNFRARVHAIDPGATCDNTAFDHLDWLQMKVHYTQVVDPVQASLNAADAAKLAGIDLFTIHFGSDPAGYTGNELLANLASGITPVAGHQNGSLADPGGVVTGNTGLVSPSAQSATTGGDGNGFEVNPTNAYADGPSGISGAAQNIDGAGDRHIYSGYNFTVPPNATITGIQTRLDWWLDSTSGTNSMGVELSWDGGATWTAAKTDTTESTSVSNSRTLGSATDTWGHTWTATELSPTNFKVRLTSNSTTATRDFFLDWVPVTVNYSINQENGDGDNFFVAPTSADMDEIFDFIGEQVCPASLNLAASPPPTTSLLNILTQMTNNNGGSKIPSDFTTNVYATNPSQTGFPGNASGVNVTVDPGTYNVNEDGVSGYTESPGAACSSSGSLGSIAAGETRVCVLTNDDIPPPPPPPNLNLNTNSWQEIPTAN